MLETIQDLTNQIPLGEDSSLEFKDLRYKGSQANDPHRHSMAGALVAMVNTQTVCSFLVLTTKPAK